MAGELDGSGRGISSPPDDGFPVTPNDSADLARDIRGLNVVNAGPVKVTTTAGTDLTVFVAAGIAFPLLIRRVWATGTTATGIVALF